MDGPVLSTGVVVNGSTHDVREWFHSLQEHPERYQFETHEGFDFVEGGFGEPGARFRTRERFLCFHLELVFELTSVREASFSFHLTRPISMGIWGRFRTEEADATKTRLFLEIGSRNRVGRLLLRFYPVAAAVRRQIAAEVNHIKSSIERMSAV